MDVALEVRANDTLDGAASLDRRIAGRVRSFRLEFGLTQLELAEGYCSKAHISAIETGHARPSVATLVHIADRLGVTLDALVAVEPGVRGRRSR